MMTVIRLRHEVMIGRVNQEYKLLCDELVTRRERDVYAKLTLTSSRLQGYKIPDKLVFEMGRVMMREDQYIHADARFHFGSGRAAADALTVFRQDIDDELLDLLESAGWDGARITMLQEGLRDRKEQECRRRDELLAYASELVDMFDNATELKHLGHFNDMRSVLVAMLDSVCNKRVEMMRTEGHPVTNPFDGPR